MKPIKKPFVNSVLKLAFLTLFFLTFSCSQDIIPDPSENLNAVNSRFRNDDTSCNSVLKELAIGAKVKGANGIDIGPDGNLYVASVNGLEIAVMDKHNGRIIKRLGQEVGVMGPDDLVFGPDGSLYWTNILVGTVGRLAPDGTMSEQFVAPGVNPITFSEDGSRLFVALDFLGDGLYELKPDFSEPPRHIIESTDLIEYPLGFLNAFDYRDGHLYGPLFAAGMVIRVDVGGPGDLPTSTPFVDGIAHVVATGFVNPASAKFGPDGMLYVLDQTGEVWRVNPDGVDDKTLFTTLQPGLDNMVFDSDGDLYMTNNDEGWVAKILPSGKARILSPGGMIAPQGLAVLPGSHRQDELFVADQFQMRKINSQSGKQENRFKGYLIPQPGGLTLPMTISADGANLVVSSWFGGAVQVWDPKTNQVLEEYNTGVPINAIRFKNEIVVADLVLGGLIWASDESQIQVDGAPLPLYVASGLATDGERLWVADWATGTIYQIGFEGTIPNSLTVVATGLSYPEGLAFDADGSLVVVETGESRLSRIDLYTGAVTKIVDGLKLSGPALEGYPPTWFFDGVAIGQSGDIYVSGGGKNVIYKVSQKKDRHDDDHDHGHGHGHGHDRH